MDRRWIHGALFTPQYICGVRSFMNFVRERFSESEKILCPCESGLNYKSLEKNEVERHLLLNGMSSTYTRWIDHGEDRNIHVLEELEVVEDANVDSSVPEHTNDGCGLEEMLGELVRSEQHRNEARPEDGNEDAASHFKQLIEDAKRELYPGCMNFTRFTFVIKMLHVKSYYRYKKDCFILATQATQVFYLPDIKNGTNWRIVQTFKHHHLYNVSEIDGVVSTAAPYQEQTCAVDTGRRPEVSEILPDMPLNRVDEAGLLVDAAEVARLRKENESKTTSEDEEGDEVEDDTLMEYLSEEEAVPVEVDSDDE